MFTTQFDAVIRDWREDHPRFKYLANDAFTTVRLHCMLDDNDIDEEPKVLIEFYPADVYDEDIRFDYATRLFGQNIPLSALLDFVFEVNRTMQYRDLNRKQHNSLADSF